jgi:hypothetical protein
MAGQVTLTYSVVIVAAYNSLITRRRIRTSMAYSISALVIDQNETHCLPPFPSLLQQYGLPAEQAFV